MNWDENIPQIRNFRTRRPGDKLIPNSKSARETQSKTSERPHREIPVDQCTFILAELDLAGFASSSFIM